MSVPYAFTTSDYLMLDVDKQTKDRVYRWTRDYSKRHSLGNALIMTTSYRFQFDLLGNRLYNFTILFGKRLPWQEIMLHIFNALRYGIVDKTFVKMRFQGWISERVNEKNYKTSNPKILRYISNSDRREDREGIMEYIRWWTCNKTVVVPFLARETARAARLTDRSARLTSLKKKSKRSKGMKMFDDEEDLEVDEYDPIDIDDLELATPDKWIRLMYEEAHRLNKKRKPDYMV